MIQSIVSKNVDERIFDWDAQMSSTSHSCLFTQVFQEKLLNEVLLNLIHVPAGQFEMGSHPQEDARYEQEGPQHTVSVPAFLMGTFLVTQAQWRAVSSLDAVDRPTQF